MSVEPNPRCRPVLESLARKYGNTAIVYAAVGAAKGEVALHFSGTESTASVRADWPFAADEQVEVPVTTPDELISLHGRPKLLKVDVEGYEREVFKGLSNPIAFVEFEVSAREIEVARDVLLRLWEIGTVKSVLLVSEFHEIIDEPLNSVDAVLDRVRKDRRIANLLVASDSAV